MSLQNWNIYKPWTVIDTFINDSQIKFLRWKFRSSKWTHH